MGVGVDQQFDAFYGLIKSVEAQMRLRGVTANQHRCLLVVVREAHKLENRLARSPDLAITVPAFDAMSATKPDAARSKFVSPLQRR